MFMKLIALTLSIPLAFMGMPNMPVDEEPERTYCIEVVESVSATGTHGYDEDGYIIGYSHYVPVGEKAVSIVIYNPFNTICDDVIANVTLE